MTNTALASPWVALAPYLQSVLRMVAAFMFVQNGTMKLFAWPIGMPPDGGTAALLTQTGIGGILELVGGTMILIGLFTRPAAFILSGEMAVAYFQFHQPNATWPIENGGIAAILYCFLWLYFSAAGAGPWSVDALRNRRSGTDAHTNARGAGRGVGRRRSGAVNRRTSELARPTSN